MVVAFVSFFFSFSLYHLIQPSASLLKEENLNLKENINVLSFGLISLNLKVMESCRR